MKRIQVSNYKNLNLQEKISLIIGIFITILVGVLIVLKVSGVI